MHHLFSGRLYPVEYKPKHLAARIRTIYRPTGSYSASQFLFLHFLKDGLVYNIHEEFHNMASRKCGDEIFIGKVNTMSVRAITKSAHNLFRNNSHPAESQK